MNRGDRQNANAYKQEVTVTVTVMVRVRVMVMVMVTVMVRGHILSSFICEKCGANILDSQHGYITGCEHYPLSHEGSEKFFHLMLKHADSVFKIEWGATPKMRDIMSIIKCICGHDTNTACSDWIDDGYDNGFAKGCYARIIDGKWVKGCKYKDASQFDKRFADRIIGDRKSFRKKRGIESD